MATSGDKVPITQQPSSPRLSPEMMQTLEMFEKMGVRPKADTPEDLTRWMMDYLMSKGAIKQEQTETHAALSNPPKLKQKENVTKMLMNHPPKITWFSGTEQKAGDTTYELWRHEVQCLLKQNYDEDAILNAVRRSLRGEAGLVAMRLELDATIHDILQKLDSIYGSVDKKEELLAEFYGSRQQPDESVTAWSCRLEGIIGKAVDRGLVRRTDVDAMLHAMLWTGLRPSLKDISGHKYDAITDFDGLRVALRQIESDHRSREKTHSKPHTSKAITGQPEEDSIQEIKGMINQINSRLDNYDKKFEHPPWQKQSQSNWQQQQAPSSWQQQQQPPSRWQQQPSSNWQQQQQPWQQQDTQYRQQSKGRGRGKYRDRQDSDKEVKCWRCGQFGHLKIGCRVRMDHSKQHLNGKKSMAREQS